MIDTREYISNLNMPEKVSLFKELYNEALHKGLILRPLNSFGWNDCIRITVGLSEENEKCVDVLKSILSKNL